MSEADLLQQTLVQALANRLSTTNEAVEVLETHISRLLLIGEYAYKIKRPVHLPFVDYSSLTARQHFCEEELRLNRRLAPTLYLRLARITGPRNTPELDGHGELLEAAVCMRRFAADALWSEQIKGDRLTGQHLDDLAARLADFHATAAVASPTEPYGSPAERRNAAIAAVQALRDHVEEKERGRLESWLEQQSHTLTSLWAQRVQQGSVRECHGDLHLHNLLVEGDTALAFDGIEFNPALRWIDVIDDIAFPIMDLEAHGRRDFAFRLLDGWLAATGDHQGLPALRFAVVYRALVRAQVAVLQNDAANLMRYFGCALALSKRHEPRLLITHGLPGSGKSVCALQLLQRAGAVRLRSDVERKRLVGLAAQSDSQAQGFELYQADMSKRTYASLLERAIPALDAGLPVILDAAYLQADQRAAVAAFAAERQLPYAILDCQAPLEVLRARVTNRKATGADPSEADADVLEKLVQTQTALTAQERASAIVVATDTPFDSEAIYRQWNRSAGAAANAPSPFPD